VVLILIAVEFVCFTEPAFAQPPTTTVLVPSNNATVSGTEVALDASASPGTTQVQFELNGGALLVATATPTIYGWVALWNSTTLPNGTYALRSVASANAISQPSTAVTITVSNPGPSTLVVLPASGATVSGSQYLDALASPGVTQVKYEISGGPNNYVDLGISGSTPTYVGWIGSWNTASVPNGTYILNSVASFADGASGTSPPIIVTLNNPGTLADLAQPNVTGAGTAALEVNGCDPIYLVVDMDYVAQPPVAGVDLHIAGCENSDETGSGETFTGSFTISTTNAGMLSGSVSGPVTDVTQVTKFGTTTDVDYMLTLTVTARTGSFAETSGSLQVTLVANANSSPTNIPFTGSVTAS
jgi:hypothetical protein